uniref:Uncharacterized protein n=1 Tax=viral metagenome TaxID=1070528 RepID=A0A6H1Z6T6_9ZZZZ
MSLPYVASQAVWSAKAVSETIELQSEFERCQVAIIEITTAAFSGTLDIQGKLHELSAFSNIPYIRQDQASIQTPAVTQISHTTDTGVYRYLVLGYWRRLQIVMTRSAGTITCGVVGSSHGGLFPYIPTKLIANSGVDIGDVDVTSISAGSNLIGKVSEPAVVETPFTGSGNLAVGTSKIAPGAAFKLTEIELHLNAAPTTGTQNLVITLDDGVGGTYDLVILMLDLVANAVTDLVVKPNKACKAADVITAAWTNTDGKTYGLKFKHQLI